jgi:hypothetical protein
MTEDPHDLRSYGRKRGRKPSPRQSELMREALPRWRFDVERLASEPLLSVFQTPVEDVWLEAGFGGAEHLIREAQRNPSVGFIGCEPFEEGVIKALSAIETLGLKNVCRHVPLGASTCCSPIPGQRSATSSAVCCHPECLTCWQMRCAPAPNCALQPTLPIMRASFWRQGPTIQHSSGKQPQPVIGARPGLGGRARATRRRPSRLAARAFS